MTESAARPERTIPGSEAATPQDPAVSPSDALLARLFQSEREAKERSARLEAVAARLAAATTLEETARVALDEVAAALGSQACALSVIDPGSRCLRLIAHHGWDPGRVDAYREIPLDADLPITRAMRTGRLQLIASPEQLAAEYEGLESRVDRRFRAWAAVPLAVEERALGGAWFNFERPRGFSRDDETLMLAIGRQAAQAVARSQLFDAERAARARAERLLALHLGLEEVARRVSEATSAEDAADAAIDGLASVLHADATMLYLVAEDGRALSLFRSIGVDAATSGRFKTLPLERASPPTDAVRTREPIFIDTAAAYAAAYPESMARFADVAAPVRMSVANLPLLLGDRVLGAIVVAYKRERPFEPDERRVMALLAHHAALALARADTLRQLRDSIAAAHEADRRKDEFLAMLGHELRNPLAPILTALHLMRLRGDRVDHERLVIERHVEHMQRLVDDLLDVARITRGIVELKRQPVELANVVAKAVELASPLLEQRRHQLTVRVPVRGLLSLVDETRMAQVLGNLLANAAKYTEPGGLIELTARREGDAIAVAVRDNGIGIAREMLPRVFDVFLQGPQAIDRAQGGLGLGLAIARNLVGMHGGSIEARSEGPGRGSEFVVRLPLAAEPPHEVADETAPPAIALAAGPRCRVLVVDDNEDAADLVAEALAVYGYETRAAHDGPAALRIAREFAPEVCVLDIGLPVMDGYELARRLRAQRDEQALRGSDGAGEAEARGPSPLRLLALTGYGLDADRERSRAAGFDAHAVKPVDTERLLALLESLRAAT